MFRAPQALVARSLPYPDAGSLVQVFQSLLQARRESHHSVPNFIDYQQNGGSEYIATLNDKPFNLAEPGERAERVRGLQVSADLLLLLGIRLHSVAGSRPKKTSPAGTMSWSVDNYGLHSIRKLERIVEGQDRS